MDALTIRSLTKSFGDKVVLQGLDLTVPTHSVFGFVGRNGAGKTTTMKAVLGLLLPDEGEIQVMGEAVHYGHTPTNRYVGYLPDVPAFYDFMTAEEYLTLCGESLGMKRSEIALRGGELLSLVGLADEKHRIKGYSRGMKQRLGIAQALLGNPVLLICDEPTSALDPIGRKEILDILSMVKDTTTVLLSTHILSDVERICTDVAFLADGRIVKEGSVAALTAVHGKETIVLEGISRTDAALLKNSFPNVSEEGGEAWAVSGVEMPEMMRYLLEKGISVRRLEQKGTSLEALFMEVTAQ